MRYALLFGILTVASGASAFAAPFSYEFLYAPFTAMSFPFGLNDNGLLVAPLYGYGGSNPRGQICDTTAGYFGCSELTIGGHPSSPFGINDSGQVVGHYQLDSTTSQNFLMAPDGSYIDLPWGGYVAINDNGDILGHGVIRSATGDLRTLSVPNAHDYTGINDNGQIVGSLYPVMTPSAFLLNPDGSSLTFQYPGAIGTEAYAINDRGDIVGRFYASDGAHSFLRKADGTFLEIAGPAGWSFWAAAINDRGQVAGYAGGSGGSYFFVGTETGVPEPASGLLAGGALCALFFSRRLRLSRCPAIRCPQFALLQRERRRARWPRAECSCRP